MAVAEISSPDRTRLTGQLAHLACGGDGRVPASDSAALACRGAGGVGCHFRNGPRDCAPAAMGDAGSGQSCRRCAPSALSPPQPPPPAGAPPFKLGPRRRLVEQLLFDPEVALAVEAEAKARHAAKSVAYARARAYAKEIIPAFSAYAYFRIGTALARRISTALYRVRLSAVD